MATPFRKAVLETLRDVRMQRINFEYGPTRVYPGGYEDVARAIEGGRIRFDLVQGNSHFGPHTPPGQVHAWGVSSSIAQIDSRGNVELRFALSATERGTIVHEATHALQDYQRLSAKLGASMTPRLAEGAAYVASWMARLQWGYPRLPPGSSLTSSHAYARQIAGRLLSNEIVYTVPSMDVDGLNRLVLTGSHDLYVFNGL